MHRHCQRFFEKGAGDASEKKEFSSQDSELHRRGAEKGTTLKEKPKKRNAYMRRGAFLPLEPLRTLRLCGEH